MNWPTAMCTGKVDITTEPVGRYMPMARWLALAFLIGSFRSVAQDSSAVDRAVLPAAIQLAPGTSLSGYVEAFYTYDLAGANAAVRPAFLYNHKRQNEVNLNLALVRVKHSSENVRASLGLMAGTYPQYNLAGEQQLLRSVFEGYAGVKLSRKHELWIDAGVLPSHIGSESAIGMDCLTLTRSINAENSPYYEAGARLSYKAADRWMFAFMLLNGWQRIQRQPGVTAPSFGTQVQYMPDPRSTFNWSTFAGPVATSTGESWRFYNNAYAAIRGEGHAMSLGADVGLQKNFNTNGDLEGWMAVVGMYRGRFAPRWWGTGRIEWFLDDAALVTTGLATVGASVGIDRQINEQAMWRVEGRTFASPDEAFVDMNGDPATTNTAFTTSLCVKF